MFTPAERAFARTVAKLAVANPFETEKVAGIEQSAAAVDVGDESALKRHLPERPHLAPLLARTEALVEKARHRLRSAADSNGDLALYQDLYRWVLYFRYRDDFQTSLERREDVPAYYSRFAHDLRHFAAPLPKSRQGR